MKQITQTGATVEEAISLALQKLDSTREQVDVEVLHEGKKGFLGFGARPAEVRVTVKEVNIDVEEEELDIKLTDSIIETSVEEKIEEPQVNLEEKQNRINDIEFIEENEEHEDPIETAIKYITDIAIEMGIKDLKIQTENEGKHILFKLESEKAAYLIGKRGATLNALQQLTQLVVNKTAKSFMVVTLDVENYRERRQLALEQLAERMADKAVRTGKKVSLEPMPSYERKVIHNALANRIDIETYSEGEDPNRYLVIEPIE